MTSPRRTLAGASVVLVLAACYGGGDAGGEPGAPNGGNSAPAPDPLALAAVAWNSTGANVGDVHAVAELDATVFVFGSAGVTAFAGGAPVGTDGSVTAWRSAATIPSADNVSRWVIGVDGSGHVLRASAQGGVEDVSDRFGLKAANVQAVAAGRAGAAGPPTAFLLDPGLAVSDGTRVTTYDGVERSVAVCAGRVVAATDGGVRVLDAGGHESDVGLPDAALVACDDAGEMLAATTHALYVVDGASAKMVYDAGGRTVRALCAAGGSAWIAVDGELGVWRGGRMAMTTGQALPQDARFFGSPSGDVWVVAGGKLQRFSPQVPAAGDQAAWTASVQPVNAAVCGHCHGAPGGGSDSSNIDLSTYGQWAARKARIYERVVTDVHTALSMPPPSSAETLTDAQRSAIEAWSKP